MIRISRYCGVTALALIALMAAGCYESAFPLDPLPQAALDPKLLSTWRCLTSDAEDDTVNMIIRRAREGVYAVSVQERGKAPDKYEAHASLLRGNTLLNIRELRESAPKPWVFGRYVLLRPNILQIQIVNGEALKRVEESPAAVRRAIERQQNESGFFIDGYTCVRTKDAK